VPVRLCPRHKPFIAGNLPARGRVRTAKSYNVAMTLPVPQWLKEMVRQNKAAMRGCAAGETARQLDEKELHTVCVEALCPNRGRCFTEGDATFMILGRICTRGCRFCAVERGAAQPPDADEPRRIADTAAKWKLSYVVLTSPTRDDLPDGGAAHYAAVIGAIKKLPGNVRVEPLIPDFAGNEKSLRTVLAAGPAVLAHNIETVPRLYSSVRRGADYRRSMTLLERSAKLYPAIPVKSGLMLGLGEKKDEVLAVLKDMSAAGTTMLTLGQYLAPSGAHVPVERYLEPAEYDELAARAKEIGFKAVMSAPLVRSSYLAGRMYASLSAGN